MEEHLNHNHDDDDLTEEERSGVGGSRWNPTKEQIELLERVYSTEGVRTPSADQIRQITARLRMYGHVEGKNVFYWFQNHKARQRQKQRHDRCLLAAAAANSSTNHNHSNVDHIARFLGPPPHHHYHPHPGVSGLNPNQRPSPIFPAVPHPTYHHHHYLNLPSPNVMSSPYYHLPQASNLVFCNPPQQQLQRYSAPAAADLDHQRMMNKRSSKPTIGVPPASTLRGYSAAMMYNSKSVDEHQHHYNYQGNYIGMTTLNLFPVHPTGILEHKLGGSSTNNSAANSCATSCSSDTNINYNDGEQQHPHFFDFFSSGSG